MRAFINGSPLTTGVGGVSDITGWGDANSNIVINDGSGALTPTLNIGAMPTLDIGAGHSHIHELAPFQGKMTDLRITKGVARYDSDDSTNGFDVPTQSYNSSGGGD